MSEILSYATLTIIFTIIGSMTAILYVFYHIIKADIKKHEEPFLKIPEKSSSEFSRLNALWTDLLKQIYEIKLDQSRKA